MRITFLFIAVIFLLSLAACTQKQTSASLKEYEEKLEPLIDYADKGYITRLFGEPTSVSNLETKDIWNYYIPLEDKYNTTSQWHSNTSTHPFQKYHSLTLVFEKDTLVKWSADIRE